MWRGREKATRPLDGQLRGTQREQQMIHLHRQIVKSRNVALYPPSSKTISTSVVLRHNRPLDRGCRSLAGSHPGLIDNGVQAEAAQRPVFCALNDSPSGVDGFPPLPDGSPPSIPPSACFPIQITIITAQLNLRGGRGVLCSHQTSKLQRITTELPSSIRRGGGLAVSF